MRKLNSGPSGNPHPPPTVLAPKPEQSLRASLDSGYDVRSSQLGDFQVTFSMPTSLPLLPQCQILQLEVSTSGLHFQYREGLPYAASIDYQGTLYNQTNLLRHEIVKNLSCQPTDQTAFYCRVCSQILGRMPLLLTLPRCRANLVASTPDPLACKAGRSSAGSTACKGWSPVCGARSLCTASVTARHRARLNAAIRKASISRRRLISSPAQTWRTSSPV